MGVGETVNGVAKRFAPIKNGSMPKVLGDSGW